MQQPSAHIIIVEPDKLLARTYAGALEHADYSVQIAHGAADAVSAADAKRPDLVVLELQLATNDGIEFLHEFRSYPDWQDIPVIVQSSLTPERLEPVRVALQTQLGVRLFLYKTTTTLGQLARAVDETLQGQGDAA
jgi:CheY-like chemotaxis protein